MHLSPFSLGPRPNVEMHLNPQQIPERNWQSRGNFPSATVFSVLFSLVSSHPGSSLVITATAIEAKLENQLSPEKTLSNGDTRSSREKK